MNNKSIILILLIFSLLTISGCVEENNNNNNNNPPANGDNPIAYINTSMGNIKLELYQDLVPNTVANFIKYANSNFYDGLVIHRIIPGRLIQGGGYYPNGTYKPPIYAPIDLETNPEARHVDGAIGIGPSVYDTNLTCQFYICDGAQPSLDDNYPVFGVVIDGKDVVRAIGSVAVGKKYDLMNWPVEDIIIESVEIIQPKK